VEGAPGLDLPALDCAAIAAGYGVSSHRAEGLDDLRTSLEGALASSRPELIEVAVEPGMALF